jgi:hypothetical protein
MPKIISRRCVGVSASPNPLLRVSRGSGEIDIAGDAERGASASTPVVSVEFAVTVALAAAAAAAAAVVGFNEKFGALIG